MKKLLPIIFVLVAVGLFFGYIDPTYRSVQALQTESERFDEALNKSKELQKIRDQLLSRYNTFSNENLNRLLKMLPDNVDNVRLVLDLDSIASAYGMRLRNVAIQQTKSEEVGIIGPSESPYSSVILSFSVASTYGNLLRFLGDLESSLRIVDVTKLSFSEPVGDLAQYQVSIKTYWLK